MTGTYEGATRSNAGYGVGYSGTQSHSQRSPAPRQELSAGRPAADGTNVSDRERLASGAAGAALAFIGLGRRDLPGLLMAAVGGALVYRGASGHCQVYESMGIDTAHEAGGYRSSSGTRVDVTQSFLINKPPEELYAFWRNFENLPQIMTHLKSVRVIDQQRSHWVAKAPRLAGGEVAWDAEITEDQPNERIAWRSLPGADVDHEGSVQFKSAPGDRGTSVRVQMKYHPPGGEIGRWAAKLFGEEPEQQVRDDLRNFKRMMEVGELLTTTGQSHGSCLGRGQSHQQQGASS